MCTYHSCKRAWKRRRRMWRSHWNAFFVWKLFCKKQNKKEEGGQIWRRCTPTGTKSNTSVHRNTMGAPWWIDRRLSYRIRPVKNRREHGLLVWKHTPSERKRERRLLRRYTHDRRFDVINHTRLVWATHFGVYHQCVSLVTIVVVACRFFFFFSPDH